MRDAVSIGGSPQVEVEFALITSSSKFFIPGAPWVGILGLAYESLAKVSRTIYIELKPYDVALLCSLTAKHAHL